jgi:glycosyltransferase involved in cell wall biosynthesis
MQKRKLHVMHVIHNLRRAGAQEVVRTLAEYLEASGECVVTVCTFIDGPVRQDLEKLGIKVELLPARRRSVVAFPWFMADTIRIGRALTRLLKQYDVDVLQTHLLSSLDFLVLALRYTTQVRVVLWTFHNSIFGVTRDEIGQQWLLKPKRCLHNLLYRLTSPLVDGFIAVSDEVKDAIQKAIGPVQDKITVICNGVDVKRYGQFAGDTLKLRGQLGLSAEARLIAVVGRLTEQKGHRYFIEAMVSVVSQYPDTHALLVGEGNLRSVLEAQVEMLNLDQHVHFVGNRSDIPHVLAISEIFVLPSLWEGLSVALLEAMAAGRPIVATAVSGTTQVMISGQTGLIVPAGNSHSLAEAMIQLLSHPEEAQAMGQKARQHVTVNFSAQKQVDEYLCLYHRLLAQSS